MRQINVWLWQGLMGIGFAVLAPTLNASAAATDAQTEWAWYRATTSGDPNGITWFVTQGRASIQLSGSQLTGKLYDGKIQNLLRQEIRGTLRGRMVVLHVVNNGTDASDDIFRGTLERLCYDEHSGQEFVLLRSGPSFIGLAREIHGIAKCQP
ncbi:MAG: hypothetical protein ACRETE_08955 [Stenotrophobium sp.]